MNLIDRLRRSYVDHGTNYVQEAADALERLTAELEATKKAVQQNYFRVVEVTAERDALVAAKDGAYLERNQLVALLSKVFPAG